MQERENDWGAGNSSVCHKAGKCWVWGRRGHLGHTQSVQKHWVKCREMKQSLSRNWTHPRPLYPVYKLSSLPLTQSGLLPFSTSPLKKKKKKTFQPFLSTEWALSTLTRLYYSLLLEFANLMLVCCVGFRDGDWKYRQDNFNRLKNQVFLLSKVANSLVTCIFCLETYGFLSGLSPSINGATCNSPAQTASIRAGHSSFIQEHQYQSLCFLLRIYK